jgi:hypothetical protein
MRMTTESAPAVKKILAFRLSLSLERRSGLFITLKEFTLSLAPVQCSLCTSELPRSFKNGTNLRDDLCPKGNYHLRTNNQLPV